jgi:hypothetical protein
MALRAGLEAVTRGAAVEVDFLAYGADMAPLRKEQSGFDYGQPMVVSKMAPEASEVVAIAAWFANEVGVADLHSCQAMEPAAVGAEGLMVVTKLCSSEAVVRSWETSDEGTEIVDVGDLILFEEVLKIV